MTLNALLSAIETAEDGTELRATQMVAGQSLLERQAGLCRAAGAKLLFVSVEGMTDALVGALDRLRAAGFVVEPVRRVSEIVDRTHARDQLMLLLDGLYAPQEQVSAFAAGPALAGLVTDDSPVTRGLERIAADQRWAGLAMTGCDMLGELTDVPDDWDLASTVLRRAVQRGAVKLRCDPGLFETGELVVIDRAVAASAVGDRVYDAAAVGESGLAMGNFLAPLVRFAGPTVLGRGARSKPLEFGAVALAILTIAAFSCGWLVTGAALGLTSVATAAMAHYVGLFTLEPPTPRWRMIALDLVPIVSFAALALHLLWSDGAGWPIALLMLIYAAVLVQANARASSPMTNWFGRLLPDAGLGFGVIGAAALADRTPIAIGALALYAAAVMTYDSLSRGRESREGFIRN